MHSHQWWWSVLRGWFYSTSRPASLPRSTPISLLTDQTCPLVHLHSPSLSHLEPTGSYVRMLFVDCSSANTNTIIPDILDRKLLDLHLPPPTCASIKDFLTNGPQTMWSIFLPLTQYQLPTRLCAEPSILHSTAKNALHHTIKFTDNTSVVGLISGGDEKAYTDEVQWLTVWCATWLSTQWKPIKSSQTSCDTARTLPLSTLTETVWKASRPSSSWEQTSQRSSPGPITPQW